MLGLSKGTSLSILQFIVVTLFRANDLKINREKEQEVFDQLLAHGRYDSRIRPCGCNETNTDELNNGPVMVRIRVYARSTPILNDEKQEFSVHLTLREKWVDERLRFDIEGKLRYLTLTSLERIWMPDLFFTTEKESHFHNMLMPNVFVRIFPNGGVYFSTRISLTADCPMNFQRYPFDRQDCELRMSSYAYFTDSVVFLWKEGDPLEVSNRREQQSLQGFTLTGYSADYCSTKSMATEWSCLKAVFSFKRDLMSSLIRIYIPSCILVLASFISFWLDPNSEAARVFLCATTLFATTFQMSNNVESQPTVSYIKAIDVWMSVCLLFIFGTLLEFATVNYTSRRNDRNENEEADEVAVLINDESKDSMKTWTARCKHCYTWLVKRSGSKNIDAVSRIVFPVSFVIFNVAYWITYLVPNDSKFANDCK